MSIDILKKAIEQLEDHNILTDEMDVALIRHIKSIAQERDAFGKRETELMAEITRLSGQTSFCTQCEGYAKDRDRWRQLAEGARVGLMAMRFAIHHHGTRLTKDFDRGEVKAWDQYLDVGKNALAAFPKEDSK